MCQVIYYMPAYDIGIIIKNNINNAIIKAEITIAIINSILLKNLEFDNIVSLLLSYCGLFNVFFLLFNIIYVKYINIKGNIRENKSLPIVLDINCILDNTQLMYQYTP